MILKKETLVFLTSLAIIFIIGYVNLTMSPKDDFNAEDYGQFQEDVNKDESAAEVVETNDAAVTTEGTGTTDASDAKDSEDTKTASANNDVSEIIGDITDITDVASIDGSEEKDSAETESGKSDEQVSAESQTAETEGLNISFADFKISKEKDNMEIVDQIEENLGNSLISENTKKQFESLLLNKNNYIEKEKSIELMLQSKGYNESLVVVDENLVKVITNDTIEQADATKILDIIVSETSYEPSQIKIVKFDSIE